MHDLSTWVLRDPDQEHIAVKASHSTVNLHLDPACVGVQRRTPMTVPAVLVRAMWSDARRAGHGYRTVRWCDRAACAAYEDTARTRALVRATVTP